mmetsp:Transcript_25940/g.57254  ORF Transcript_25940/g.57254 Transcript_25940/m.57254 type:complete len:315 (+) Transcript_25940:419-1363(+)
MEPDCRQSITFVAAISRHVMCEMDDGPPAAFHTDRKNVESQSEVGRALHGAHQGAPGKHGLLSDQAAVRQACIFGVHHVGNQSVRSLIPRITGIHVDILQRRELILILALCAHDTVAQHHCQHIGVQLHSNCGSDTHRQLLLRVTPIIFASAATHPDMQTSALRMEPQGRNAITLLGSVASKVVCKMHDAGPTVHAASRPNVKLEFELLESLNASEQCTFLQSDFLLIQQLAQRKRAHRAVPHLSDCSVSSLIPRISGKYRNTLTRNKFVSVGSADTRDLIVDENQHVGSLNANANSNLLSERELLLRITPAVA